MSDTPPRTPEKLNDKKAIEKHDPFTRSPLQERENPTIGSIARESNDEIDNDLLKEREKKLSERNPVATQYVRDHL